MAVETPVLRRGGRHLCVQYSGDHELAAVVAKVIRDGLEAGERVGYTTAFDGITATEALSVHGVDLERATASGQLVVIAAAEVSASPGGSRAAGLAATFQEFARTGLAEGYAALRMVAEVDALVPAEESIGQMQARESLVRQLMAGLPVTWICLYDRGRFPNPYLSAAADEHDHQEPETLYVDDLVTITRDASPSTVRLLGEVDLSNAAALRRALVSVVEEGFERVTVDVSELRFIDVAGLRAIVQSTMAPIDVSVCLRGAHPPLPELLRLCGWDGLPKLTMCSAGSER